MQTDGDKQAEKQIRHTRLKPEEKKKMETEFKISWDTVRGSWYQTNTCDHWQEQLTAQTTSPSAEVSPIIGLLLSESVFQWHLYLWLVPFDWFDTWIIDYTFVWMGTTMSSQAYFLWPDISFSALMASYTRHIDWCRVIFELFRQFLYNLQKKNPLLCQSK